MSKVVSFKAKKDMIDEIDRAVERGNFTSRGEFLRSLVRNVKQKELSRQAKEDIEESREQEGRSLDELL
ncbi:MAG: ribbon-helix-helix domain-containing protein [Candidatus Aenigmatarchaeota archaeon]